jgi:tryptophan synthase alpha chain
MSRIESTFNNLKEQKKKALVAYLVVGDPDLETTLDLMELMVSKGADILELGISFSDPMAEGPTIQRAHERALENKTTLSDALDLVTQFRKKDTTTPLVFMGYMNPFEAMGAENFCSRASKNGLDGILLVDMPPEESKDFTEAASNNNLDLIRLIAPTTDEERIKNICTDASGYIYYISVKGVTGANHFDPSEIKSKVNTIQSITDLPVVVGFGIKDADSVTSVRHLSDGIVVGSALVAIIAEGKNQISDKISKKIEELSSALLKQ